MSWFYDSPPDSIHSFQELQDAFLKRFQLVANSFEGLGDILGINQRPDKSLRKFINRWRLAILKCRILDKGLANQAFQKALPPGDFKYYLNTLVPPPVYDEVMDLAISYAKEEFKTYGDTPSSRMATPVVIQKDSVETKKRG
ncbi:hypothetical protein ACLB2K_037984 [Fragaria x ananassa]